MNLIHIFTIFSIALSVVNSGEVCSVGNQVYQDGDRIVETTYHCVGWGAAASQWQSHTTYCRDGKPTHEVEDGQCYDNWICCPAGNTAGCVATEAECPPPKTCTVDDVTYEDGALIEAATYKCEGWGAAQSQWTATEKRCRDGEIKDESYAGECAGGWACCPVGDTAGCVSDWQQCEYPKTCTVDDKVYQDGEIIGDLRHDCKDDHAFTITQEVCREGEIKEESYDGACEFGMCCQYGDFVGCTSPNCDSAEGRECFFAGESYPDGAVIKIVGYTCPYWGAGQSAVQVTENTCRDGTIEAETRDIPCDHNWACCQVGQNAMCMPTWQDCPGHATSSAQETAVAAAADAANSDSHSDSVEVDTYHHGGHGKRCYIDDEVYENGESIRMLKQTCGWGAAERVFTIQHEVCRKGKVRVETYDGECESGNVCCQNGDFVSCMEGICEEPKGNSCFFAGREYQDGDVVDVTGYTCPGWGAMQSELQMTETVCRDGDLKVETSSLPCANGWACCQVGKQAMCMASWQDCPENPGYAAQEAHGQIDEYKKKSDSDSDSSDSDSSDEERSCNVDGKEYQDGEVIRDTKHQCIGYHTSTAFAIFQEVCRNGNVEIESFDGECEVGVCCQYGDFVGCTTPNCEVPKAKSCFFAGVEYEDGVTIDIMGYTCPGWGAMQSEVIQTETVCRDGDMKVEEHRIPCANNWACCQIGRNAACVQDWQSCPVSGSAAGAEKVDEAEMKEDGKGSKVKDIMEVYAIAQFVENKDGAEGEVVVDENGNVEINLDLSSLDTSVCGSDVSLSYVIYNEWNTEESSEKYGYDCDVNVIGDKMMDPFGTDLECEELSDGTEPDYVNCKLGDLSGRFGAVSVDSDGKISVEENLSYASSSGKSDGFCGLRLSPEVVYGKSIVFRCNNDKKTTLFCARFDIKVYDEGRE